MQKSRKGVLRLLLGRDYHEVGHLFFEDLSPKGKLYHVIEGVNDYLALFRVQRGYHWHCVLDHRRYQRVEGWEEEVAHSNIWSIDLRAVALIKGGVFLQEKRHRLTQGREYLAGKFYRSKTLGVGLLLGYDLFLGGGFFVMIEVRYC